MFGGNASAGGNTTSQCSGTLFYYNGAGEGGDGLYLICNVLVFNGLIDLRGENAYNSTNASFTKSGGGGGGSLILSTQQIISNSGAVLTSGGLPSTGCTCSCSTGGNGGNGSFLIIDR